MGSKALGPILGISNGGISDSGLEVRVRSWVAIWGNSFLKRRSLAAVSSVCCKDSFGPEGKNIVGVCMCNWSGVTATRMPSLRTQCPRGGGETFL